MVAYVVFRKFSSKSPSLWHLLLNVKLLELQLQCVLQVIHVHGATMISQGTDGISSWLDMQTFGSHQSNSLIPLLCCPAPPTSEILQWALFLLHQFWPSNTFKVIIAPGKSLQCYNDLFFDVFHQLLHAKPSFRPFLFGLKHLLHVDTSLYFFKPTKGIMGGSPSLWCMQNNMIQNMYLSHQLFFLSYG